MKRNIATILVLGTLATAAGIYFGMQKFTPVMPQSAAVSELFGQKLADVHGLAQPLAQWRGKQLVVNFWATWCAPCVEEMPELTRLQTELAGKNTQIIGIGIDKAENIAQFAARLHISYPLYVAGTNGTELSRLFGNQAGGLPYTVVIDPDGRVKATFLGRLKMDELRAALAAS